MMQKKKVMWARLLEHLQEISGLQFDNFEEA